MFVAFEGIDGTGKTTLVSMLKKDLMDRGYRVFATKEPTDALALPDALKESRDPHSGLSLFFRFTEDRFVHQNEISKHLELGEIVLCDRYILSSMAYQGVLLEKLFGTREKAISWMSAVSDVIRVRPDITFYLDVDPVISMRRISRRGALTGFEENDYLSGVREFYKAIDFSGKIAIDASGTIQQSFNDIMNRLLPLLRQ